MQVLVRVTPKASRNAVKLEGDHLKVYVTAPPVDGEANEAVIEVLAKHFRVPKSKIELLKGHTSRDKLFELPISSLVQPQLFTND